MTDRPTGRARTTPDEPDEPDEEWSGWTHPAETVDNGDDGETASEPSEGVPWKAPPAERPMTIRERIRRRYGFTDRQWYVIETLLLVAPYPLFVLVYLYLPVDETLFLAGTLVYSLFAMYAGLLS